MRIVCGEKKHPNTIPVRIDRGLYDRVARLAAAEGRKVRAQLERLAEQALAEQPRLEVRGAKGGAK